MDVQPLLRLLQTRVIDNSPLLLTSIGVTGVVSTAALAAKAGFKAAYALDNRSEETRDAEFTKRQLLWDDVKQTWTLYIPTATSGVLTIACVLTGHYIGNRRNAALVTAFAMAEHGWREYQAKVVEQLGSNKELKIRDDVASDRVLKNPVDNKEVLVLGSGQALFYESMTGRYFRTDVQTVRSAVNDVNKSILSTNYASLNDFFREVGLPVTGYGEEVGWTLDHLLEIQFTTVLDPKGEEAAISIGYSYLPVREYHRFH